MWVGDKIVFPLRSQRPDDSIPLRSFVEEGRRVDQEYRQGYLESRAPGRAASSTSSSGRCTSSISRAARNTRSPIEIEADLTEVRPRFQNVSREVRNAAISPTGVRAVFEAHGEIITVPAEKGEIAQPHQHAGRDGARLRHGRRTERAIAYFSDESGEYALHIKPQNGGGGDEEDSAARQERVLLRPEVVARHQVDRVHRQHGQPVDGGRRRAAKSTKVDTDHIYDLNRDFNWSGDSKWIAFERFLPNRLRAIWMYSVESGKSMQITDGMSDARHPGLRSRRPVSVFHGEHQLRADHQRAGYEQRRARGDQQHLPGGAAE